MDEDYREADEDVEVLVDGTWHFGELRGWAKRDGAWYGHVAYRAGVAQQYLETLPADRIRPAPTCARDAPEPLTDPDADDTTDT